MSTTIFNTKLSSFIKSSKTQRDKLQFLIEAGLWQYAKDGQTAWLGKLLTQSKAVKSIPTVTLLKYIKECTDLKCSEDKKTGVLKFSRIKKDDAKKCIIMPVTWYNWKGGDHNATEKVTDHEGLAVKHLSKVLDSGHSMQYLADILMRSGFTTEKLINIVDSVQLKAA
jgi:hypothetical protein